MNRKKKSIIIITLVVVLSIIFSITSFANNYISKQNTAHEIAELARSIGLPEDDVIIKRAQEIWWEAQAEKEKAEKVYLGNYRITGYDPNCAHCCGKSDGITSSGAVAKPGYTIAMKDMPFGTKIYIEGLGTFEVQDRGVGSGVIDIALSGHQACYAVTGRYDVWVIK